MFDGKTRSRNVSYRGKKKDEERKEFIVRTRENREQRAKERQKAVAADAIARVVRGRCEAGRVFARVRGEYLSRIAVFTLASDMLATRNTMFFPPAQDAWMLIRKFTFCYAHAEAIPLGPFKRLLLATFSAPRDKNVLILMLPNRESWQWQMSRVLRILLGDTVPVATASKREGEIITDDALRCISILMTPEQWPLASYELDAALEALQTCCFMSTIPNVAPRKRPVHSDMYSALRCHLLISSSPETGPALQVKLAGAVGLLTRLCLAAQTSTGVGETNNLLWAKFALAVLSIPRVNELPSARPLLQALTDDHGSLWLRIFDGVVQHAETLKSSSTADVLIAFTRIAKVAVYSGSLPLFHTAETFSFNPHAMASESARILHFFNTILLAMPLTSIMYVEDQSTDGIQLQMVDEEDDDELLHSFSMGGAKRMELFVRLTQKRLLKAERQQLLHMQDAQDDVRLLLTAVTDVKLVANMFSLVDEIPPREQADIVFMDVDTPESKRSRSEERAPTETSTISCVCHLCVLYTRVLMSFPVHMAGRARVVSNDSASAKWHNSIMTSLAFGNPSRSLVSRLWRWIKLYGSLDAITHGVTPQELNPAILAIYGEHENLIASSTWSSKFFTGASRIVACVLYIFFVTLSHSLLAVDDEEFYNGKPLSLDETKEVVEFVKVLLYRMYWVKPVLYPRLTEQTTSALPWSPSSPQNSSVAVFDVHFLLAATRLFNQLAERNTRRTYLPAENWLWPSISTRDLEVATDTDVVEDAYGGGNVSFSFKDPRVQTILSSLPQVIPFRQRAAVFQQLLQHDREANFDSVHRFSASVIQVRRDQIYADAYNAINRVGKNLKHRLQVTFISEHGVQEAGIDGGGVFKEFMDALSRIAFNPETGLFMLTTDQLLMPNPLSDMTFDDHVSHFAFLGRILGKAMYEQILIEPMFSLVFLNILLGRINHLDDLYSLDSEMYRSLVRLKHIAAQGEDLSSLGLFFEVTVQRFGVEETIELIPGGSTTPVTAANIITYIHRLSHFKLNVQTANQTRAFLDGFRDLIPVDWIRMFSARELQLLIGGDIRAIDVVNMRSHTHYTGGYHDTQPYIQWFWEVLESMSPDEQAAFLKFTTSCPRQPLLGFQNLTPQFCIQRVPARQPQDSPDAPPRLPSTATCMNLMKLPQYDSKEQLKEKLLYAVKFNSGFELS